MNLNPYLKFNGNAAEAMKFYQAALGGELKMTTFAESGFPEGGDRIMHADLRAEGITLMASDARPDMGQVVFGDDVDLSLTGPAAEKERLTGIFNKLSEGGQVTMPLAEAPWGDTFGMFKDKFGNDWMVNVAKA